MPFRRNRGIELNPIAGRRRAETAGPQQIASRFRATLQISDEMLASGAGTMGVLVPVANTMQPIQPNTIQPHDEYAHIQSAQQTPRPQSMFPLSSDHTLLHVVTNNVFRAIITNWEIINAARVLFPQYISCCENIISPILPVLPPAEGPEEALTVSIPQSLEPTEIQQLVPHPSWIDLMPFSQLRDTLIIAAAERIVDLDEFTEDLVGDCFDELACGEVLALETPGQSMNSKPQHKDIGLVAWANPWEHSAWEITEALAKKWAFLFKDCPEVIASTNQWRSLRGEDPIMIEL